ncbi:MAG: SprT family zinc-dependent metalloprotease [Gallionella sp.]|nr:SprT family zinc-dependent metalloprotease [Gallionella sp.]
MLNRLRNLITPPTAPARGAAGVTRSPRNVPPAIEQRAALLAGKHITYTLKRSNKRRSIGLRIDDRGLTVSMPLRASESWLRSVLEDKAHWVVEKLDGWCARKPEVPRWVEGETLRFMGEPLTLRVRPSLFAADTQQRGRELFVFVADATDVAAIERDVMRWYRQQAAQLFPQRVAHYAALMNVNPREVKLSSAKTQWGSCTARGTVRLNEQLMRLPLRVIDYVVVHELAHLREMNHSTAFWLVVKSACPDYLSRRRELKAVAL